jgi:putative membrane protein insertion efficiency factor
MRRLAILFLKFYQRFLSPVAYSLGARCRFYPTCSEYAMTNFKEKPLHKAFVLSLIRLLKCGPWHEGGIDR